MLPIIKVTVKKLLRRKENKGTGIRKNILINSAFKFAKIAVDRKERSVKRVPPDRNKVESDILIKLPVIPGYFHRNNDETYLPIHYNTDIKQIYERGVLRNFSIKIFIERAE